MAGQTQNGKAFEYACLKAIQERLRDAGIAAAIDSGSPYQKAKGNYDAMDADGRRRYDLAAETAVRMIAGLEPCLLNGDGTIILRIAADVAAMGVDGDVRDVLCIRSHMQNGSWEIGLSCKHNHEALRHPRITAGKDFGSDWVGIPCSADFMREISPVIDTLIEKGDRGVLWNTIPDKLELYYVPILRAYKEEIKRMCAAHSDVPARLVSYFFGANDFYKIIMKERASTTTVEGFNMHATLNKACGRIKPLTNIPLTKLPTRLIEADFKKEQGNTVDSKTTIILNFDNGWAISMRLHNKDKIARPTSLAWDVTLAGLPPTTYVNTRSWFE